MHNSVTNPAPYDPYTLFLDPYAPTPMPTNDIPDESDGNCCLGKAIVACDLGPAGELIAAYGLIAGAAFIIGCVVAAIFSGPILTTALWFAASTTISLGVMHVISVIGEELNWHESVTEVLEIIAAKLTVMAAIIIGMELGAL